MSILQLGLVFLFCLSGPRLLLIRLSREIILCRRVWCRRLHCLSFSPLLVFLFLLRSSVLLSLQFSLSGVSVFCSVLVPMCVSFYLMLPMLSIFTLDDLFFTVFLPLRYSAVSCTHLVSLSDLRVVQCFKLCQCLHCFSLC